MTSAERRQLERIRDSGVACATNLARFLLEKSKRRKPSYYRKQKKLSKREARAALVEKVRAACVKRAAGRCECGCGLLMLEGGAVYPPEWDEFYGRRNVSVETTWMLTRYCHMHKTSNHPTRAAWDEKFKAHCEKYGYPFKARPTKEIR